MPERDRTWKLRQGYLEGKGNPMEDPFRLQRPKKGQRVVPGDRLEFYPVDVADIRERFDMPQTRFARLIGISVETLRNWERGRRKPVGPSRALLRIAAAHPYLVSHVLGQARAEWSWEEEEAWEPVDVVLKRHRARAARRRAEEAEREEMWASFRAHQSELGSSPEGPPKPPIKPKRKGHRSKKHRARGSDPEW